VAVGTPLFDAGLQPERTDLAWRRTALGYFVNAALVARFAVHTSADVAAYTIAALLALTGTVVGAHAKRLYATRTPGLLAGIPAARHRALLTLSLATSATTLASLVLVVLA
jgi:uncharacterized membrane protein YidH (DUF202 family)